MKRVVAREAETFVFRRGVGLKAQYYAICLLNQMRLSHKVGAEEVQAELVMIVYLHIARCTGTT